MNHQLHLLTPDDQVRSWRIDAETREVGRRGLAQARAALLQASMTPDRPPRPPAAHSSHSHSHIRAHQNRSAA